MSFCKNVLPIGDYAHDTISIPSLKQCKPIYDRGIGYQIKRKIRRLLLQSNRTRKELSVIEDKCINLNNKFIFSTLNLSHHVRRHSSKLIPETRPSVEPPPPLLLLPPPPISSVPISTEHPTILHAPTYSHLRDSLWCFGASEDEMDQLDSYEKYLSSGQNALLIKRSSGAEIPIFSIREYVDEWCRTSSIRVVRRLSAAEAAGLKGGVKRKRKNNKKRRRAQKPFKMVKSVQLGQINRFVPYDKPIITTLRFNASFVTDGSGNLSARLSLRDPIRAFNGSGSYVNAVDFAALYDQYKVKMLQVQFEPLVSGPLRGPIVMAVDYDSLNSAATPNYANLINYGGYRIFNAGLQFETQTYVPNITSAFNDSTDPPTALLVHQGGWLDAATPAAPGNMYFGGINLGNSVTLGNFVATMRIAWRFRR